MARNLNWFQARASWHAGKAIRREDWRKWLLRGVALWFIERDSGADHLRNVVFASEFTKSEFLASDWTDEPWIDPETNAPVTRPIGRGGVGSGSAGSDQSGGGRSFGNAANPAQGGGGGGGGGGSGGGPQSHNPPAGQGITVSVEFVGSMTPSGTGGCIFDEPQSPTSFFFRVSISGTPYGVGLLSVTCAGQTQLSTAYPGFSSGFGFQGIPVTFGSSVSCTATFSLNGSQASGTGSGSVPPQCSSCEGDYGCCPGEDGIECGHFFNGMECCCCTENYAPVGPGCGCVYVGGI